MTPVETLAIFILMMFVVSATSLGVGAAAFATETQLVARDGSVALSGNFSVRDIASQGDYDVGSADHPYSNSFFTNLMAGERVVPVSQLLVGQAHTTGHFLAVFAGNELAESTLDPDSLAGGPFMPLAGGAFSGDVECVNIVNASTVDGADVTSLLESVGGAAGMLCAFGAGRTLQSSGKSVDAVVSVASPQPPGTVAIVDSGNTIQGYFATSQIVVYSNAVNNHICRVAPPKTLTDTGVDQGDLLLAAAAVGTYAEIDDPNFTGPVVATTRISTAPVVYGVYALNNAPVSITSSMLPISLSGIGAATAFLSSTGNFAKDGDGKVEYTGPVQLARVSFSFTTALRAEAATLSVRLTVGANTRTNTWVSSASSSTRAQPMNVTFIGTLATGNTVQVSAQYSEGPENFTLSHTSLQICQA